MLQGVVYPVGIINLFLQFVLILWGLTAVFQYISRRKMTSPILKATYLLLIMYIIYGTYNIMFGEVIAKTTNYFYLKASLNSLVPIFLFHYFAQKKILTIDRIRLYLPVYIVISIIYYYQNEKAVLLTTNAEEITNNVGYMFTSLIPLLFFYVKKPLYQYLFLIVILLFIFMAMKRGAVLIGIMSAVILLYNNYRDSSKRVKFYIVLLSTATIIAAIYYVNYMIINSSHFAMEIEKTLEGNSSGRDFIYERLWNTLIEESNAFYFFLGRGANSTISIAGNYAHQDWLETFCNNGLLGVCVLMCFFYRFGKTVWLAKKNMPLFMTLAFFTLFLSTFSKTLFSMSIQNLDLSQSMLLGYFSYLTSSSFKSVNV